MDEIVLKYQRHLESNRKASKKYKENHPFYKKMASIRTMMYQAKKKNNTSRVEELQAQYADLKSQYEDYKKDR